MTAVTENDENAKIQILTQQIITELFSLWFDELRWEVHGYLNDNEAILVLDDIETARATKQRLQDLNLTNFLCCLENTDTKGNSNKINLKIKLNTKFIEFVKQKLQSSSDYNECQISFIDIKYDEHCYIVTNTGNTLADERYAMKESQEYPETWDKVPDIDDEPLNEQNKIKITGFLASLVNEKTREAIIKLANKETPRGQNEKLHLSPKDIQQIQAKVIGIIIEFADGMPEVFDNSVKLSDKLRHLCPAVASDTEKSTLRRRLNTQSDAQQSVEQESVLSDSGGYQPDGNCLSPGCFIS